MGLRDGALAERARLCTRRAKPGRCGVRSADCGFERGMRCVFVQHSEAGCSGEEYCAE